MNSIWIAALASLTTIFIAFGGIVAVLFFSGPAALITALNKVRRGRVENANDTARTEVENQKTRAEADSIMIKDAKLIYEGIKQEMERLRDERKQFQIEVAHLRLIVQGLLKLLDDNSIAVPEELRALINDNNVPYLIPHHSPNLPSMPAPAPAPTIVPTLSPAAQLPPAPPAPPAKKQQKPRPRLPRRDPSTGNTSALPSLPTKKRAVAITKRERRRAQASR